jgi:hypothetical protein
VDVDVGGTEVGRSAAVFAAGEELGYEPAEHDQIEVVGAQCVEELKERVLGELASGERSSSKSDMDQLLAYVLGGFFAAPAQRL